MRSKIYAAALLAMGAMSFTLPAMAQGIEIGPGGVRLVQPQDEGRDHGRRHDRDRDRDRDRRGISEREAINIARGEGLREVDNVRRTERAFRIVGADRRGRDIRVDVDRRNGDVLSVR